jgi:hypothetical protein
MPTLLVPVWAQEQLWLSLVQLWLSSVQLWLSVAPWLEEQSLQELLLVEQSCSQIVTVLSRLVLWVLNQHLTEQPLNQVRLEGHIHNPTMQSFVRS